MKNKIASPLWLISLLASRGVFAADVTTDLHACASETNDSARLACYDKLAGRGSNQAPPAKADDNFGAPPEVKKAPAVDRIFSKVTKIERLAQGRLLLTLDNSQVWEQTTPDSQFSVQVGDVVKIKSAAFSSFLLITPSNRFTNVRRVR